MFNEIFSVKEKCRLRISFLKQQQKGAALIIVILFFVMISVAIIQSATIGAIVELRTYQTLATSKSSYVAAEAGIEDIFYRTITGKLVPAQQTIELNHASSTVNVVDISETQRDVYATGDAKNEIRKIYLSISKNKTVTFPYGAQVGEGGITMKEQAKINAVGLVHGGIYSDGQIIGANGVSVTGNAISSSGLMADPFASSTVCAIDESVGRTEPGIDFAQSFVISATTSMPLAKISVYMKRNNNPKDGYIRIAEDNSGQPSTTAIASQELNYSSVGTSYSWVNISFGDPPVLDPETTYWIVFDTAQDNSKYWYWCRGNADHYPVGSTLYKEDWSAAGAWTAVTEDVTFKITLGGGISKINEVCVSGVGKADAITDAAIGGDAYYQTISGSTVSGVSYPGSLTPPYVPLPISTSTITQWKSDAATGGTINGDCGSGGLPECNELPLSLGPKKISGDLHVDGGNDPTKVLTVNGTLHVTGDIIIENKGKVQCAFTYLGNSCVVIADGYIRVRGLATLSGSGVPGSYLMMLSTKKGCLGGEGSGCSTNGSAIAVENNVDGALFYATDSLIDISNGAVVTAVVGYMIQLQNGSKILYNNDVATLSFMPEPSGVTGAWNTNRWSEY